MVTLNDLVHKNNFEQVKQFIQKTKHEHGWKWCYDDRREQINDACRDAVLLGHERIVQLFLDEGLYVDSCAHSQNNADYPLVYFAAKVRNLSMVKFLVNNGAKIQDNRTGFCQPDHQDALRIAIQSGYTEIVQYLLENGGNADASLNYTSCLVYAAREGHKNIVELLVQYGAWLENALATNYERFNKSYNRYDEAFCLESNEKYTKSVEMLLDYAMGTNLTFIELAFLKKINITGFNFVGVAVNGQPITREMLAKCGFTGADKAIVTRQDIDKIEDLYRRHALLARLEALIQRQGSIISNEGIVNLVPLADAAQLGHFDVVQVRLKAGVNPNQKTTKGIESQFFAIEAAAKNDFFDVVKLIAEHPLLDNKAIVSAANEAKKAGHIVIEQHLMTLIDVNAKDDKGEALIHKAALARDIAEVKRLLNRGADINLENAQGKTPLYIAAFNSGSIREEIAAIIRDRPTKENIALLEFLLSQGADPNMCCRKCSPLKAAAVFAGSAKAVELLLPVTEKKDSQERYGAEMLTIPWYYPLMFSSEGSNEWLQILTHLRAHGADINVREVVPPNETVLHKFMKQFRLIMQKRDWLERYKKKDDDYYKESMEEAKKEFAEQLHQLDQFLSLGADPRATDDDGKTPLHVFLRENNSSAIEKASIQVIERFLKYGVDVNTSDSKGVTFLDRAEQSGDLSAAKYLIERGAKKH